MRKVKRKTLLWGLGALAVLLFGGFPARAQTIYDSPYVTFSPDGQAWTTNAADKDCKQYDGTSIVRSGIESSLRKPEMGEHYYRVEAEGVIPVGEWRVAHKYGQCIHSLYRGGDYHGISYGTQKCRRYFYSGWEPYCADCGEVVPFGGLLFYMSEEAAASITYLETGSEYYYCCPFCNNLEQGSNLGVHLCKAISYNRYRVTYNANTGGEVYGGYMPHSYHIYNNAAQYEGQAVTPVTHLTLNCYTRTGWEFAGWNTAPDGSGDSFGDGAEIFNLSPADYGEDPVEGTVTLYALWKPSESTLQIDPGDGSYRGKSGITSVVQDYGTQYLLDGKAVTAPEGYTVSFEANGGKEVPPVTGSMHFVEWRMEMPFYGKLEGNRYEFTAPNGSVSTVAARYGADPVVLPGTEKEGASFGGWYFDPECKRPAGGAGDRLIPGEDLVLYAQWVDLVLTAEDNYTANGGKGAVDLQWAQSDSTDKVYKLYQSRNRTDWKLIASASDIVDRAVVEEDFAFRGNEESYTAPYTGIYLMELEGAQGGGSGALSGGKGAKVTARVWLRKGEVLRLVLGGQDGFNGGGAGTLFANGGGCSIVSSDLQGTLLIAGGGGGATALEEGKEGGSSAGILDTGIHGETGGAGGGGGYCGGCAGELILHCHTGDSRLGGGCYTKPLSCGGYIEREVEKEGGLGGWYCAKCDDSSGDWECEGRCPRCGREGEGHCMHEWYYPDVVSYHCSRCGAEYGGSGTCSRISGYGVSCGREEGEIVSSRSAYGGSNYVNPDAVLFWTEEAGVKEGDGAFRLSSEEAGFLEELSMEAVPATDLAAPDEILPAGVTKEAVDGRRVRISWAEPEDHGTTYYHKAESYRVGSATPLCSSNLTMNTLTSGVKGYYYLLDTREDTVVTEKNGSFLSEPWLLVSMGETPKYLHLAAVDGAGNLSGTSHVALESSDVAWKLHTDQMTIAGSDNVYAAEADKTWYVRCGGNSPVELGFRAYVEGEAAEGYQPDYAVFSSLEEGREAQNIIYVPNRELQEGEIMVPASQILFAVKGSPLLECHSYTKAVRSSRNRVLTLSQQFLVKPQMHGRMLEVIPHAGAEYRSTVVYSDWKEDGEHSLYLIGDGEAPVVSGLEGLEWGTLLDRRMGSVTLDITAADDLSGVKEFYLKILNADNVCEMTCLPGADGHIRLCITEDEPIFSGDFTVSVHASDHVGNERELTYGTTEFALETSVERILEPHEPVFRCGESGILTIVTWGYADRVEVEFPPEMAKLDPDLNRTYTYTETPDYKQEEVMQFMIPLDTPRNVNYTITVRAYKDGQKLEEHPAFSTVSVGGSILEEIRDRLR